jgi:hypothetical protein
MSTLCATPLVLIDVQAGFNAAYSFNKRGLDGSIYHSGLVHQISLSNLAGEYASITRPGRLFARSAVLTKVQR